MATRTLALNDRGELTYCTVPPERRGIGRCNHVAHQNENESVAEFIERVNSSMTVTKGEQEVIVDQQPLIDNIIKQYKTRFNENPDWEDVIKNKIPNYFTIGKGENYEEAEIQRVRQIHEFNENGDPVIRLEGEIEFRGETYIIDFGQVPEVQDDGTIIINGSKMRVLPILAQTKSGLVRYRTKSVIKTEDGNIVLVHEPGSDVVLIKGKEVPIEEVAKYFKNDPDDPPKLTMEQIAQLDKIDPVFYKRFPDVNENFIEIMNDHTPDEANDITWRKVYTYEDQVRFEMDKQMRRMGVTFRTNLARRQKAEESGDPKEIEKAEQYPLFYQKNNTKNILSELTGRSNVQLADNLNPLSALSQSRKISLTGPGGYNKDKAPAVLRQVDKSHRDVIDSLDISSGKNVGLTMTLSNADISEDGFIVKSEKPTVSVSDFIPYKKHNDANRAAMAVAHMKQAVPIVGGEDPRLLNDSSDKYWKKISGAKIGTNLRVAYYATEGTHEDAVVISESAAKKMMTRQDTSYKIQDPSKLKLKVGDHVQKDQEIGGVKIRFSGKVKEVNNGKLVVESEFPMGPGDKIAGRHGNKGVVSKVVPDDQMPKIDQGNGEYKPAEILMSPLGVVGRMNLGQVYETNGGVLNKKTKVQLPNGRKVDSTAGHQFIMRLNHIAEKKLQAHHVEFASDRTPKGLRLGEMESLILSSSKERRAVLNYLRYQESSDALNKLDSLLKAVGVKYKIIKRQD